MSLVIEEYVAPRFSPRFNSETADVVFLSSDGVRFHIHRKNLEITTGAFPGPEIQTRGEVVPLTETAETLDILFQFSYPQRQPELEKMEFKTLVPLAEAVEKYEVFPAMPACYRMMKTHVSQGPAEVLAYAGRHGYKDLANEAAPLLVMKPLEEMIKILPPPLLLSWVLYREKWSQVLQAAYAKPGIILEGHHPGCAPSWTPLMATIVQKLSTQLGSISDVKEIFATHPNTKSCCSAYLGGWQRSIEVNIQNIPKFSTFL